MPSPEKYVLLADHTKVVDQVSKLKARLELASLMTLTGRSIGAADPRGGFIPGGDRRDDAIGVLRGKLSQAEKERDDSKRHVFSVQASYNQINKLRIAALQEIDTVESKMGYKITGLEKDLDLAESLARSRFAHIRKLEAEMKSEGIPIARYTSAQLTGMEFVSSDWKDRAQNLVREIDGLKHFIESRDLWIEKLQVDLGKKNAELKARGEKICELHKEKNTTPKKTNPSKVGHFQAQVVKLQKKEDRHIREMEKKDVALRARNNEIRDLKKSKLAGPNEKVGLAVEKRLQVAIAFHHTSKGLQTVIRWVAPVTAIAIIALAVVKIYG